MRNKYPGICYRCGETVAPKDGHFERFQGSWRTQHASCAITFRRLELRSKQDGKAGKIARRKLNALSAPTTGAHHE